MTVEDGIQHDVIWMEPKRGVPPPFSTSNLYLWIYTQFFFPSLLPQQFRLFSVLFSLATSFLIAIDIYFILFFFFASLPSRGWSSFQFTFFFHGGDFYNPTSYAALVSMCDPIQLITTKLATVGPDIPFWSSFLLFFFWIFKKKKKKNKFVFCFVFFYSRFCNSSHSHWQMVEPLV